jgi:hypothetical protein
MASRATATKYNLFCPVDAKRLLLSSELVLLELLELPAVELSPATIANPTGSIISL